MDKFDKWTLIFISVALSILCAIRAHAEPPSAVIGGSFLASTHRDFPCKRMLKFYREQDFIYHSTLWDTFGKRKKCLKKLSSLQKPKFIEIIFSNEVCRRKGNCAPYEWRSKWGVKRYNRRLRKLRAPLRKRIIRRTQRISKFCLAQYGSFCGLSVGLESQFTKKALNNLINTIVSTGYPSEFIIHNPNSLAPYKGRGSAHYLELHSTELHCPYPASQCIYSADGLYLSGCEGGAAIGNKLSSGDSRAWVESRRKRAAYIGLWCPLHQGLSQNSAGEVDPRGRTLKLTLSDMEYFSTLSE